ncbi:MAG TPA: IPT/TIG domain-containing protein, partial [Solirubrobacteraceae bacterium]|nr:IPT/TIG domain-containing protein [Solirubrobacteraceae bacterium]
ALLSNGTVEAWGSDAKGQLGNGEKETNRDAPVAVQGLIGVHAIAAGEAHSLAALTGGEVYAWGSNKAGELGNNTQTPSDVPVQVSGLTEVASLAAGANFSVALQTSGNVWTWGTNGEGQLGIGSEGTPRSLVPVQVTAIHQVNQISASGTHSLVAGPKLPTVTGLSPIEGSPAGGTHVTITGTGFTGVSAVHFGATNPTEYTVESANTIHAVAPAGSGVVQVTVTVAGGTSAATPASEFSYVPIVTDVTPAGGSQEGGTSVVIHGTNFEGVEAVDFGKVPATDVKVESATEVTAVSPAGVGTVDVTLVGPGGKSLVTPADEFVYAASPPEIGHCAKASTGKYTDSACTQVNTEGKGRFEWLPGPGPKPTVIAKSVRGEQIKFETVSGKVVECTNTAKLTGHYANAKVISDVVIHFTGCKNGIKEGHTGTSCKGLGENEREGNITTATLTAQLGIVKTEPKPEEDQVGLAVGAPGNGKFMEFECQHTRYVWRGGAILPFKLTDRMLKKAKLKFFEDRGHQSIESFENETKFVLSAQIGAAPAEQGAMLLTIELANKEKMEVNLLN